MNATLISIFVHREVAPNRTNPRGNPAPEAIVARRTSAPGWVAGPAPRLLVRVGRGNARL